MNPSIRKGLIARPAGFTPFDHTSVIRTIQQCFKLGGTLTERDKAAPDFSCLLTRDAPRKDDIPEVEPLNWNVTAGAAHINALHRLISKVLSDLTGNPAEESTDLMEYIHSNYKQLFGGASNGASGAS